MSMDNLSTNPRRATLAVTAGAVIGALGVAIVVLLLATAGTEAVNLSDLIISILIFLVALVGWSLGLFLLGLPLWWLFHRNGWRGWRVAMLLGAFTTFVIVLLLEISGGIFAVATGNSDGGDLISFVWIAVMALLGAIVALVIWRIAYRPVEGRT
jgi:hypothetical protein